MKVQYPASLTNFEVKFWRYSVKDLARIGTPALAGWFTAGVPGLAIGATAGLGLAELKPQNKNLDQFALDYIDYRLSSSDFDLSRKARHRDAIVNDDIVTGFVKVDSVDLDMASSAEWQMNRDTVADLFKEIDYPIEIHSQKNKVNLSDYKGAPRNAEVTDHYIVVHDSGGEKSILPGRNSDSQPINERIDIVSDRCREIRNTLTAGDLYAEHLTGKKLSRAWRKLKYRDVSLTNSGFKVQNRGTRYHRLLYLTEYPEEREPGLLSDLLNLDVPGSVDVIQTVEPVTEKQQAKLGRLAGRLRVESAATPDQLRGSDINRMIRDTEDMIESTSTGDERLVNHSVYVIAHGKSRRTRNETVEEIIRLLRRYQVEHREPRFRTHHAFRTYSPFYYDSLKEGILMPTRSAAGNFAFSTHDKIEEGGTVFGTDTRNESPVILDRFLWEAGHLARMGKIGSGKSYAGKLVLLRSVQQYDELQIQIVDPKQEYGDLVDQLGGETLVLDETDLDKEGLENSVTRYTVNERGKDYTELLTEAVRHIYQEVSQNDDKTIVLVDEAHRLLRSSSGRTALGELVREGRDRNVSVEMITQNASDFTRSQEGRDILKNVNCYIFMRHQDVNTGVSDFFNLSRKEALELQRLRTGTDLPFSEAVIRGPVNTKLRVESSQEEHEAIEGGASS